MYYVHVLLVFLVISINSTNNLVEVWHGAISADAKKHLTINKTVEHFRKKQSMAEMKLLKAINGEDVAEFKKVPV